MEERVRIGRAGIGDMARTRWSKRASNLKGTLEVIRMHCPHCHHHKALRTQHLNILKCARCKARLD